MTEDNKKTSWADRNDTIKTYKVSSSSGGWLHLIIARKKDTHKYSLRLKKYMNWFSISSPKQLKQVLHMLKKGAKELNWEIDDFPEENIDIEEDNSYTISTENEVLGDVPEEVIEFIETYPDFVKKFISLKVVNDDVNYVLGLLEVLEESIAQSGNRLKVAFVEVIEKISKQDPKAMFELSDLMKKWNLLQITSVANLINSRLETIETFEKMIHNEETYEINTDESIHRVLENSMWLIDENYWIIQSNRSLRNFIGDEIIKLDKQYAKKRPDFACVNTENKLIILEIKRPSIELKKEEIDQAELYLRLINKYKESSFRSMEAYLIGNKISNEAREIIEHRKNIYIKTYDDLLENCRNRYKKYLDIIESKRKN